MRRRDEEDSHGRSIEVEDKRRMRRGEVAELHREVAGMLARDDEAELGR